MNSGSVGQRTGTARTLWTGAANKGRRWPWAALINVLPIGDAVAIVIAKHALMRCLHYCPPLFPRELGAWRDVEQTKID